MRSPFDTPLIPGLFLYKDRSQKTQSLLFQFNPETLKRSRTVTLKESPVNQKKGTVGGRGTAGSKYAPTASNWKIDFDVRFDGSRTFPVQLGLMLAKAAVGQGINPLSAISSVLVSIRQLEALVEPVEPQLPNGPRGFEENAPTPEVDFYWGLRVWRGYVTSLTINETLFSAALLPMMAEASISMEIIEPMSSVLAGTVGGNLI